MIPFGIIEGPAHVSQPITNPYHEGGRTCFCHRVLHGALSRLEPSAVKVARSVLRGGGDREVSSLPDQIQSAPGKAAKR